MRALCAYVTACRCKDERKRTKMNQSEFNIRVSWVVRRWENNELNIFHLRLFNIFSDRPDSVYPLQLIFIIILKRNYRYCCFTPALPLVFYHHLFKTTNMVERIVEESENYNAGMFPFILRWLFVNSVLRNMRICKL